MCNHYFFNWQDEIRIAKMMAPDPVGGSKYTGFIPAWYHMQCFLGQVEELDAAGVSAQELSGFSKLKESDKSELAKKFGTKTTARGYVIHRHACMHACTCRASFAGEKGGGGRVDHWLATPRSGHAVPLPSQNPPPRVELLQSG